MSINELLTIDPSKECLKFLHDRVLSDNYRGGHYTQHNRYTFEQVLYIFQTAYEMVGTEKMVISTTDISKKTTVRPDEKSYYELCDRVTKKFKKFSVDAMRKNLFVDFHRMGFINRYNSNGKIVGGYERCNYFRYFSLTDLTVQLLNAKSLLDKQTIFIQRIEFLLQGKITEMIEILRDEQINNITIDEYMYFVSFIGQELNGKKYDLGIIRNYIREYKRLLKPQKMAIERIIKNFCKSRTGDHIDEHDKRHFGNWKNEAQQVFMLAGFTAYFDYEKNKKIFFRVSKDAIFTTADEMSRLKRSITEKHNYFSQHKVTKKLGYELHHIVPLLWAKTATEFFILDKWQNMLYIDGGKHAYISQSGNIHIKLNFDNNNIILYDPYNNYVKLEYDINVMYALDNKQTMADTNANLLASF